MRQETLSMFDKNPDNILQYWKIYPNKNYSAPIKGCYAVFYDQVFKKDLNYYFAFPGMPIWYPSLIDEFNSKFENIKYEIITDREGFIASSYGSWGFYEKDNFNPQLYSRKTEVRVPLFTIKLSDGYDKEIIKYLYYFFHHFLRVCSFGENYLRRDSFNSCPEENLIEYVLSKSNVGNGYRSLSEEPITEPDLLKFDNIEEINKNLSKKTGGHKTQTDIFLEAINKTYDFKMGEIVICKVNPSYYSNNNKIRVVGEITGLNNRYATIHLIGLNSYNSNTRYVNLRDLEKLNPVIAETGKFKLGDQITTKLTCPHAPRIDLGVITEIYEDNLAKASVETNNTRQDKIIFTENYKKIFKNDPKYRR